MSEVKTDTYAEAARDFAKDYVRGFLRGTVTSVAKALALGFESLTGDAAKAVDGEKKKIEALGKRVAEWRKDNVDYEGD